MSAQPDVRGQGASKAHLFPPALIPVLRARSKPVLRWLDEVPDAVLGQLLTTVFFAGLETHEGERNAVRVVFLGKSPHDLVMPEDQELGAAPIYRWKILRFASPRPFVVRELVKLAVATREERLYAAVCVLDDNSLSITGLAREGVNVDGDPFLKVIASRPGGLSIRSGRHRLVEYERGSILTGGEEVVLAAGPVRRALESMARSAASEDPAIDDYLEGVRSLVREMAAHGHGGILIIDANEHPPAAIGATYGMVLDSSLASLLRLSRRVRRQDEDAREHSIELARGEGPRLGDLLRNAFLTEAERMVEELGALTAIDGATLLNRDLALIAFGVILPISEHVAVVEAIDSEGSRARRIELGARGTRHRASATYAARHPGSVVFVASEDGEVTCMCGDPSRKHVLSWRVGPGETAHA